MRSKKMTVEQCLKDVKKFSRLFKAEVTEEGRWRVSFWLLDNAPNTYHEYNGDELLPELRNAALQMRSWWVLPYPYVQRAPQIEGLKWGKWRELEHDIFDPETCACGLDMVRRRGASDPTGIPYSYSHTICEAGHEWYSTTIHD